MSVDPTETGTIPDAALLRRARARINPELNRTPVLRSRTINELCGGEVYFKCENMQRVGLIISGGNVDLDHLPWTG